MSLSLAHNLPKWTIQRSSGVHVYNGITAAVYPILGMLQRRSAALNNLYTVYHGKLLKWSYDKWRNIRDAARGNLINFTSYHSMAAFLAMHIGKSSRQPNVPLLFVPPLHD